ncbi:MAG: hypoxanthine phosphoribosyltransferase [Ruminiclostridium sp.]|nr:hypoxanthine phosphoribosyltransferase [Ruminiclostridium sp.]
MRDDMKAILYTKEEVAERVRQMGAQLTADYKGEDPILVGVLRGSFIFMADLVRCIETPLELDFVAASSYGTWAVSTGQVDLRLDLEKDIIGRHVIVVEDILDTGRTLSKLVDELKKRHPASLKLCVLLDKPERRVAQIEADYVGFTVPDEFVVGCGLDFNQKYRQLPYIGILKPSVYE